MPSILRIGGLGGNQVGTAPQTASALIEPTTHVQQVACNTNSGCLLSCATTHQTLPSNPAVHNDAPLLRQAHTKSRHSLFGIVLSKHILPHSSHQTPLHPTSSTFHTHYLISHIPQCTHATSSWPHMASHAMVHSIRLLITHVPRTRTHTVKESDPFTPGAPILQSRSTTCSLLPHMPRCIT